MSQQKKKGRNTTLIDSQIGCGYCKHEETCKERDPKVNKAKLGCKQFIHHEK